MKSVNDHPVVKNHREEFDDMQNLEIAVNFILGFMHHTLPIDTITVTNCTVQVFNQIVTYQQIEFHVDAGIIEGISDHWLEAISEIANFLYQVDPIAKACVPAFYETYFNSHEYKRTFNDQRRIVYNIIYRLDKIYENSYKVNDAYTDAIRHSDDPNDPNNGSPRKHAEYVAKFKLLGELFGDQFKYFWSTSNHEGHVYYWTEVDKEDGDRLYIYPDSELEIIEPDFDEIIFPGPTQHTYPYFKKW